MGSYRLDDVLNTTGGSPNEKGPGTANEQRKLPRNWRTTSVGPTKRARQSSICNWQVRPHSGAVLQLRWSTTIVRRLNC